MKKSKIAKEYREKYGWDMPTLKLARILYKENNILFTNLEDARSALKYIEGKSSRSQMKTYPDRPRNPYHLPESEEKPHPPIVITGFKRIGILSDVHLPYHDLEALTEALTRLKELKIDALILNGDIIDCYHLSRFVKNPKNRDFKYEIDTLKSFFDKLAEILKCKIYFKIGNHENRYQLFLTQKAHELAGIEEFEFVNIIKAREKDITIVESNQIMKIGSLYGIHGHEYMGGGGFNVAKKLFDNASTDCFMGHHHRTTEFFKRNLSGNKIITYSIGTLSNLQPAYLPLNNWNHGFAWVDVDGDNFEFHNIRI